MKYIILHSASGWFHVATGDMEEQVNKRLKEGYKLDGNLIVQVSDNCCYLAQAMIKED